MKEYKRGKKLYMKNLNIELADNGIIIRNEANEDEVTLALKRDERFNDEKDRRQDIYKAIGEKIYDWLIDDVIDEQCETLKVYHFAVSIGVLCLGKER